MPIFEQGYRPYLGPIRRGSRARAIAWESFRPRMRWWVWLLAFGFAWWPWIVVAGVAYFALVGGMTQPGGGFSEPDTAFPYRGHALPTSFVQALLAGSGTHFWTILNVAFSFSGPVVLAAVSCAGILASDRRTGALQIYLSRPVRRLDYLLGKTMTVCAFSLIVTLLPALALWIECAALQSSFDYVRSTWWVPLSVTLACAIYTSWVAALVLLVSSLVDRPALIATTVIFVYLFLLGLGNVLASALREQRWLALVPHYALGGVTAPLFGLSLPEWLPAPLCLPMAVGFPLLAFVVVVRRVRAVEVVA